MCSSRILYCIALKPTSFHSSPIPFRDSLGSSQVFAIDVAEGSVRWVQSGDGGGDSAGRRLTTGLRLGGRGRRRGGDGRVDKRPLLLQREDYLVRQIGISDGEEAWSLTVSHFAALDFQTDGGLDTEDWGGHGSVKGTTLPRIVWGYDGETIKGVDQSSDKVIWSRKVDSVVAAMYGVEEDKWVDIEIVQEASPESSEGLGSNENNVVVEYRGDEWAMKNKDKANLPRVRER